MAFQLEVYQAGRWTVPDGALAARCHLVCGTRGSVEKVEVNIAPGSLPPIRAAARIEGRVTFKTHLAPEEDMVISEPVFRCPLIVVETDEVQIALFPDFAQIEQPHQAPFFMDFDRENGLIFYGVGRSVRTGHVYYRLDPADLSPQEPISFAFYVARLPKPTPADRDYRALRALLFEMFGKSRMTGGFSPAALLPYAAHAYRWAFNSWRSVLWQQFELNGKAVGGSAFIVCARQKPGMGQEQVWREPKSIWNQAWFSSLRSAYGYRLYGQRTGNRDLINCSERALNFALAAPMTNGLFPGYFEAGPENRFDGGRWVRSCPRRPAGHEDFVHLLDASWTCLWLVKWYRDIESRKEILDCVARYVETLQTLQRPGGEFPAWVHPDTLEASPYLIISPETAMHAMLLLRWAPLAAERDRPSLIHAARRACDFALQEILPAGRWEDFETYWSCAKEWEKKRYGVPSERDGLYNHNTLGMYWCAEALLDLYEITGEKKYLDGGERALSELSFYQQLIQPACFPVETLGGFGSMNSDDEWNDARQSLFALTYLRYACVTGNAEYRMRALYAMKASFYMMYCPENASLMALYQRVHPFLDDRDYGFHMENFNHHDGTCREGLGEFTIFDWGNGAACASLMEFLESWDKE